MVSRLTRTRIQGTNVSSCFVSRPGEHCDTVFLLSGAAFPCLYPSCARYFAVRSNAKRHLRTHGIIPVSKHDTPVPYTVGFNPPVVQFVEQPRTQLPTPTKLKWVPLNLSPTTADASSLSSSPYLARDALRGDRHTAFSDVAIPGPSSARTTRHKQRESPSRRDTF